MPTGCNTKQLSIGDKSQHAGANDILLGDPHVIKQAKHTRRSKTLILPDNEPTKGNFLKNVGTISTKHF